MDTIKMRHPLAFPTDLRLCTTLERDDEDGDAVLYDMLIYYHVVGYHPGCSATEMQPADPPVFEFAFARAEFAAEHDDAPGPLTAAENSRLAAWFAAHHADAVENAIEHSYTWEVV